MSASEIISEIEKLPAEERRKITEFVHKLEAASDDASAKNSVSAEFKKVAHEIFTTNAELFHKLAQ